MIHLTFLWACFRYWIDWFLLIISSLPQISRVNWLVEFQVGQGRDWLVLPFLWRATECKFFLNIQLGINSACKLSTDNRTWIYFIVCSGIWNWETTHNITSQYWHYYFGYGNPRKNPRWEKQVQQSDIDFIMRKYGTVTITTNPPKPGVCSTRHNHWAKPQLKPQHPPARVYDPAVRPPTHADLYGRTESVRSVRQLYRIRMACTTFLYSFSLSICMTLVLPGSSVILFARSSVFRAISFVWLFFPVCILSLSE